jgi:NADPH:quinone reductase-like Zn-dependent oxidoreductase
MKAARYHKTGGPEVIHFEDVPDPRAGIGEAVVRVRAAAINRLDIFLRSGASGMPGFTLPHTGGFDIAGEVAEVGDGVDPAWVGKPVVVDARVTGPASRGRLDIIGTGRPGGFAEKVLVPAHCLRPKPENYTFEEAAAFGCVYLTAFRGLAACASVKPGEVVLVQAGGSGAGTAAIQTAKAMGATVITTVGSDEKCAKAKELLGCDHAVNYKTQDFVKVVKDVTDGRGADVAFDPVWGTTAQKTLDSLALGARWIVIGMVGGLDAKITLTNLLFREVTLRGVVEFYADAEQIAQAWSMAHRGVVRPIIAKAFPLAELGAAQRTMESGEFFGKIVVTP